ncbi:hypothetical protein GQ607_009885 [Colletotrichum asianum]|uniref:Uncharacterized protein n=1 Tax=Colletotrichum asianum TaxID=702518 RepID=A0A8H3ZK80_9PEZI|nr:hypothetical protein GQ607_009885 [Colletotrichum asianum]
MDNYRRPAGWSTADAFNSRFTSTIRRPQQSDLSRTRNIMSSNTCCAIARPIPL